MVESYVFYKDQLEGEYLIIFNKVELYSLSSQMPSHIFQERLLDFVEVLLTAQREQRSVSTIVGADFEVFCEQFVSGVDKKSYVFDIINSCKNIAWVVLVFSLLDLLEVFDGEVTLFEVKGDMAPIFFGAILGVVFVSVLGVVFKKLLFKLKRVPLTTFYISFFGFVFLVDYLYSGWIFERYSLEIFSWVVAVMAAIYLILFYQVRKRVFPTEWKKVRKMKFSDLMFEKLKPILVTNFQKENEKRRKKGKDPMSEVAYTEKLAKKNARDLALLKWLFLGIIAMGTAFIATESTPLDTLIFFLILCAVEFPIYRFFIKAELKKKELFDECKKQGTTLIEYLEKESTPTDI